MKEETPQQLLRDPEQKPDEALFRSILTPTLFRVMEKIHRSLTDAGIDIEWRYYKDGNAWQGKAAYRKKTVVWISLWENLVKAGFYFTQRPVPGCSTYPFPPE
jgi:acyl-CoA thioesterase